MPAAAPLRILYFAWLREHLGMAEEAVALPDGVATVAALVAWQCRRGPVHATAFSALARVRCAVNQQFAAPETPVAGGDEVAFFPPLTGG